MTVVMTSSLILDTSQCILRKMNEKIRSILNELGQKWWAHISL